MLRLANEQFLYALVLIPLFVILHLWAIRAMKNKLKKLGDYNLVKTLFPDYSVSLTNLKWLLYTIAFILVIIGIVNPQIGSKMEEVKREGVDVMIALDISNSMKAQDIKPNRLEKAKQTISRLIESLENDRIGIVVFAGQAFTQLPITADFAAAKLFLSGIDCDMISSQGTAIGSAIELAKSSMDPKNKQHKVLLIITDGENHEDDAEQAAAEAKKEGIIVHTIGMGSPMGGPIPDATNGYLKDKEGNVVVTKLNEEALSKIASAGGGLFVRTTSSNDGLQTILKEINKMQKNNYGSKVFSSYEDRFQYFLFPAFLILLIELLLSNKKNSNFQWKIFKTRSSKPLAILFFSLFLSQFIFENKVFAQKDKQQIREGNKAFENKKFNDAEINYRKAVDYNPNSTIGTFNLGDALYKQEKYEEAASQFEQLLQKKLPNDMKANAFHNLGNSQLKLKKYEKSIKNFKSALKLNPSDKDTKYNLAYAQSMLKKDQNDKNNKDNKDNKDKKDNKDNKENKDKKDGIGKDKNENKDKKNNKDGIDKNDQNKENKDDKKEGKQANPSQKLSQKDAQRMLEALNRKEKDAQKKLSKKEGAKIVTDKNW